MEPNIPTTEIVLPGTTTEQLRRWAANVESENPIAVGDTDEEPVVSLDWTDSTFMGVILTFRSDAEPVHRLVILADNATEEERLHQAADLVGVTLTPEQVTLGAAILRGQQAVMHGGRQTMRSAFAEVVAKAAGWKVI